MCDRTIKIKKMTNKERLRLAFKKHTKWLKSLGLRLNKYGKVITNHIGYDFPNYKVRASIPTSDRISGNTYKKIYATRLPEGKTISVAYNKGPYMIVDAKDFKTMGRKV